MKIDVWSDFICPFCYIGKRRLEFALKQFSHSDDVEVTYRSYELEPDADAGPGSNMYHYLAANKGMTTEQAESMIEKVGAQAADVGLTYNFATMQHTNSFDAHRLAQYAAENGKGHDITERLLKAYFTDSELISDAATLVRLAGDVGLNKDEVAALLQGDDYADRVRGDEEQASQLGAGGVPFFVFNDKYGLSGAQPQEVFSNVLEKVWQEEQQPAVQSLNPQKSPTMYCTDEGCEMIDEDDSN